jgi:hypothetical protein
MAFQTNIEADIENVHFSEENGRVYATYIDPDGDKTYNVPALVVGVQANPDPDTQIVFGDAARLLVMKKYMANPLPEGQFELSNRTWTVKAKLGDDLYVFMLGVVG